MLRSSRTGPTKIGSLSRASAVIVGALVALFGVIAGPLLGVFAATSASAATTGSGYTAITPYRALGTSAAGGGQSVVAGTPATVQITSATAGEVPAGATAVVLNVTASAPTSAGYLEVYPTGAAPNPPTSNVNFTANETVANLVTVPLSATGGISVLNSAGTTLVDVDVEGFYSAAATGLYNPISPVRVSGANGTPIAAGATTAFTVTGTGDNVPTGATAVVVNLTASAGTAASYLSAYAAGATPATTSSLNTTAGETVANRDIVNVGTGGQIDVFNLAGTTNVDVDVDGYYAGTGGAFVPLAAPVRVTDTRSSTNGTSIASGGTETFNLATTASGVPTTASAVAANFTVVPGVAPGYITVFPTGVTTQPNASDVNWPASSGPVPNFTQAGVTAGAAQVYNLDSGSPIDVVIDDFGYFTGITSGVAVTATPSTITSNGSAASLVNAVVTNTGSPVNADPLAITATPSAAGVCSAASLSATTGVTNSAGTLATPITYTATTTPGTCTIKFTEADHQLVGTTVVTSAPNNTVAITTPTGGTTTAPHLVAENGGTQNIVSTVTSSVGAGVVGDVINFTLTPNTSAPGPGCGTLAAPSETTGTGGVTPADVYTTPFNLGVCTITATEATAGTGETAPQTANTVVDSTITTPVLNTLVLTTGTATPAAGAADTVTATVLGPTSTPLANDPVLLTLTNTSGTSGVLNTTSGVTNASGVVTFTYTAPTTSGAVSITGIESSSGVAATAAKTLTTTVAQNDAVAVSANPSSLTDNGTSTSAVSVTDTNSVGAPVVGTTINFTLTPSVTGACGTLSSTGGITNSSGSVAVNYTSSSAAGFCTITATEAAAVSPELAAQNGTTQITEHV